MRLRALVAAAVLAVPAFAQTGQAQTEQTQTDQPAAEQGQRHAMSPEAREALRKACAADIQTYCSNSEQGGGRVGRCLRQNLDKLSADCQTQLKAMRSQWRRQDQPQPQQPQ